MPGIPNPEFALTRSVLAGGIAARAFPAAAIEVGRTSGPLWQEAFGRLTFEPDAPATTTRTTFDLASLTKIIATTSLAMRHVATGRLDLDAPVSSHWPTWGSPPRSAITPRHLLEHSSGVPAHAKLWETARGRREYEEEILRIDLDRQPGQTSVYSDLGFIALGFLLEDLGGPLAGQMASLAREIGLHTLGFRTSADERHNVAPTEFDVWRNRLLIGEVHDENAAALDGVASHAGLFARVEDVGIFARTVLRTFREETPLGAPALMRMFAARSKIAGSSRALGWDTMLPTSSCGTRLSPAAIGHTGFTGTSLWIDPSLDLYVAFLTNRVHPTRANEALRALRPRVHDAVVEDLR